MTALLTVMAALAAYAFVAGMVHAALLRIGLRATRYVEDGAALVWPIVPALVLMYESVLAVEWTLTRISRLGGRAYVAPGDLLRRWRRGRSLPRAVAPPPR